MYQAASNEALVGGDFFDAFAVHDDKVALVVGDVSGKGLAAATRTAEVKYALRAFLHITHDPDMALAQLNDFVCDEHRHHTKFEEAFIILALAIVDATTGEVVFSGAGADPCIVLRAGGKSELIEMNGNPLGIIANAIYETTTVQLEHGDTVIMATDGLTEARHGQSFLEIEGVAELAEAIGPSATLQQMCAAIYRGAYDHALGNLRDDVCLLLARRQQA
jgi:sigma-B regulation protein RsbU (phosphoserine phosphatase)